MNKLEFINPTYSDQLFESGGVVFPLLLKEDVALLLGLFKQYHDVNPEGFYASTHGSDNILKKQISDDILSVLEPRIQKNFKNIKVLGGAFLSKAPGQKGILPLHQDWNIVDESKSRSYNLWIPLVDVNAYNGAMRILKGSHAKQSVYRGPNIPPVLYQISDIVEQHMDSIDMNSGEGFVYDHALWHSSPENQSNELRLAIVMGVIPNDVEMKYYYQNGSNINEYNSHPQFFFENDPEEGPNGLTLSRTFLNENKFLNEDEFNEIYLGVRLKSNPNIKKSFFSSLFRKRK